MVEAVGIADTAPAVAELAQLLEIRGGARCARRVELLCGVAEERGNEIFEMLGDLGLVFCLTPGADYRVAGFCLPVRRGQGLADSASGARGRCGCTVKAA